MSVEYARHYRRVRKAIPPRRRRKVWCSMVYRCAGPKEDVGEKVRQMEDADSKEEAMKVLEESGCGFERRVFLGVGCEGPPELREANLVIPVPMYAGICPRCGSSLQHVRWNEDEAFEEKDPPEDAAYFVVPGKATAARYAEGGYAGAELVRTKEEIEAVGRFHSEVEPRN